MFETTIAGSLPKPSWLAEPNKLWPQWKLSGEALAEAKRDATLLWIKAQEDAGIDTISDGEQSRRHEEIFPVLAKSRLDQVSREHEFARADEPAETAGWQGRTGRRDRRGY